MGVAERSQGDGPKCHDTAVFSSSAAALWRGQRGHEVRGLIRDNIANFHNEAVIVRREQRETGVGVLRRHVAVLEPQDFWFESLEVDRTDDRPVIALGINLN